MISDFCYTALKLGQMTHIKDKQRIFAVHDLRRTIRLHPLSLLVPPEIPPLLHGHLVARPLQHEYLFDEGTFFERGVDDGFGGDGLAAAFALAAVEVKCGS